MAVLSKIVGFFFLGNGAVFNGLGGAVADAGHAMGAVSAPDGSSLLKLNVIQRTQSDCKASPAFLY